MRAVILGSLLSIVAMPVLAAETVPGGVVACISQKYAQQYTQYVATSPDFARDLIDRAACYLNKDAVEAVPMGQVGDYRQFKLLSGHKIWVDEQALVAASAGSEAAQ